MTDEGTALRSAAVRNLTALGLSEYAARTLVALTRISGGSAREVSDASSVPRTRVYDAMDELAERGFARVRESRPKTFEPESPQRIRRAFYREYVYREALAEWGLRSLAPADDESRRDVAVTTGDAVARHFHEAIADAGERLTYVTVGEEPTDDVLAAIDDATVRGVTVRVVAVGGVDPDLVRERLPGASVLTVPYTTPPVGGSRFLTADESVAMLSTAVDADDGPTAVGLVSERPGTDVAVLLQRVVDTWLADAE